MQVVLLMNGVSLMEMLLNLIFYTLDTAVVMDDMIDSILKLGLCGCYILVQVSASTFHVNNLWTKSIARIANSLPCCYDCYS